MFLDLSTNTFQRMKNNLSGYVSVNPFLYSVNLTEYVVIDPRVSVCVCVCLSVCLCHLYSPNEWTDFDETLHKSSTINLPGPFFSYFENSNLMTSWRPL